MEWILPLDRVDLTAVGLVGGKAARLGAMAQAGFDVPEGLVISADAFRAHLPHHSENERPATPRLSAEFVSMLSAAIAQYLPNEPHFAVRSSAIDEDSVGASFAGQHSTYYFVKPEHLAEAVVDCWLSLWTSSAISYREQWGVPPEPMAVIVQRMVMADSAGVSFSQDPSLTHKNCTVIEATWGLGATLVDGRVSPDQYLVSRRGVVSVVNVGDKQVLLPPDPTDATHGRLRATVEDRRKQRVLSDRDALEISEATEQIATVFGHPVDVEWAFEGSQLKVLQARPITTLLTDDEHQERLVLFKPIAENFSEPFTPMTEDLYRRVLPRIGRFVRGRLYLSFDLLRPLLPFKLDEAQLADLLLLRNVDPPPISWRRLPIAIAALSMFYLTNGIFWHRSARLNEQSLARLADVVEKLRESTKTNALTTLRRLLLGGHPFQAMHRFVFQINVSSGRAFILSGILEGLLERWAPAFDRSHVPSLTHGGNDMFSTRMVDAVATLAEVASSYDDVTNALLSDAPFDAIMNLRFDHPFIDRFGEFLDEFGHRGSREIELASPRWREDASALLTMIRNHLDSTSNATDDAYARHLAARDELHQALPSRWRRRLIDRLIRRIRYYIVLRENTRHYHTMIFDLVRHKLKALEAELISARQLQCEDDIFYLTWDEVEDLRQQQWDPIEASQRVRERRIFWQAAAKRPPVDRYNISRVARAEDSVSQLSGVCACPGTAEGIARVIMNPESAASLQPGDILVAPYTDPTWTPLFPPLAGIVVEVGSYLSHAGTIAREYRIPCVVDVSNCTTRIVDGSRIRISADEGLVFLEDNE